MSHFIRHFLFVVCFVFSASVAAQGANADEGRWEQLSSAVVQAYREGRYADGIPLAEEAYRVALDIFGETHPQTLTSLNNLAGLYLRQGRYGEAEPLFEQALQLRREVLGETHPSTLTSLNNLAALYERQGRYGEAEPLFEQALQLSREVLGETHPDTLGSLNNLAALYESQGHYGETEPLYEQALQLSREVLGETHPSTLTSLNNLAALYRSQGRYGEAEPLYEQALQLRREVLGETHPSTLISLNNLAALYRSQGRDGEAEPLLEQALQLRREVLGETHPSTLTSLNSLALLYESQGRYGEAEPFYEQALQLRREVLGETHPSTLTSLNNLAALYRSQGRYGEAEPLYEQALQLRREVLGETHPSTLISLNNLALLYESQGRYGEAEPLYEQGFQLNREVLGETHPQTLTSLNNLALLYESQGLYGEAEPLYEQGFQLSREVLGKTHPQTLSSLNNLAILYERQGRYGEAEPLYEQALQHAEQILGQAHPTTLVYQTNYAALLVHHDKVPEAVAQLRRMEPQRLAWIGAQLYSTQAARVQSQLLRRQSSFQDIVLTLGISRDNPQALILAGDVMLRWKQLQGEEQAYLARLVRAENDPEITALGQEIAQLRADLSRLAQEETPTEDPSAKLAELEAKELKLAKASRTYKRHLEVSRAGLDDVQAAMPSESALIEFRQYQPYDFETRNYSEPRWAALLVRGLDDTVLEDVGSVEESSKLLSQMLNNPDPVAADQAAAALHAQLFGKFAEHLDAIETLYIAADGLLSLIPFERLRLANGDYWGEAQQLRFIQTGRDLLPAPVKATPAKGLLALGGIDFGPKVASPAPLDLASVEPAAAPAEENDLGLRAALDATRAQLGAFSALPGSGEEVGLVQAAYELYRSREPITVWRGKEASEARLKSLDDGALAPPRVLHLATHGFYLSENRTRLSRPQLYSGLTLADANLALKGERPAGDDGILYSLEAQGLNLEGTELVVLSACETGQGSLDYSEGVVGLVRALRVAGAENVLMTLWPVGDHQAKDFMRSFYNTWLSNSSRTPAEALAMTKAKYQNHPDPKLADPKTWAPYVLIEG